jgi:hypothetical protein
LNMINYACEHVNWAFSVKLSATLLLSLLPPSLCPPPSPLPLSPLLLQDFQVIM